VFLVTGVAADDEGTIKRCNACIQRADTTALTKMHAVIIAGLLLRGPAYGN